MTDDTTQTDATPAAAPSVPARRIPFAEHMAAEKAEPIAPLQVLGAGVRQAIAHEDYTRAFQLAESMLPYRHARLNAVAIQGDLFGGDGGAQSIQRDDQGRPVIAFTWQVPEAMNMTPHDPFNTIDMQPVAPQPQPEPVHAHSGQQHTPTPGAPDGDHLAEAIRRAEIQQRDTTPEKGPE